MKDHINPFVIPVKNTYMFVFTSSFSGCILGQMIISKAAITTSLLWSCFWIACIHYLMYFGLVTWIAYRVVRHKPIEPFMLLIDKTKIDKLTNDSLNE